MTIAYSVNGGNEIHGVISSWQAVPRRHNSDGNIDFTPIAVNIWEVPKMTADLFETLQGLQGTALNSLETNDIVTRNTGKTYVIVIMQSLEGEQVGRNIEGVIIHFEVQI